MLTGRGQTPAGASRCLLPLGKVARPPSAQLGLFWKGIQGRLFLASKSLILGNCSSSGNFQRLFPQIPRGGSRGGGGGAGAFHCRARLAPRALPQKDSEQMARARTQPHGWLSGTRRPCQVLLALTLEPPPYHGGPVYRRGASHSVPWARHTAVPRTQRPSVRHAHRDPEPERTSFPVCKMGRHPTPGLLTTGPVTCAQQVATSGSRRSNERH